MIKVENHLARLELLRDAHQIHISDNQIGFTGNEIVTDILQTAFRIIAERDTEIARLKAEIDVHRDRNVVHFLEGAVKMSPEVLGTLALLYHDEPEGTIMRATDTHREWVLRNGELVENDG